MTKRSKISKIVAWVGVSAIMASGALVGCGSDNVGAVDITGGGSGSGNSNAEAVLTTDWIDIAIGAENKMCNDALVLKVTGIQRRPVSIFAGNKVQDAKSSTAAETSTNNVVIEVDVTYTWNVNKYTEAVQQAGNNASSTPSTLGDILKPSSTLAVEGLDSNGDKYLASTVIAPDEEKDTNQLGINAQWDYDVLNSPLPDTAQEKSGSILLVVSSTASDLKLYMVTPASGQQVGSNKLDSGRVNKFSLDLT